MIGLLRRAVGARIHYPARIKAKQLKEAARLFSRRKDVGPNSYIDKSTQVLGWDSVQIGDWTAISEGSWLNVNVKTPGHKSIVIGHSCYIGKRNFISSGWLVSIGDYCMTGIDCKFMSADHAFDSPLAPYLTTGVTNDKSIVVGTNVWIGAGVTVVGNVSIGSGSIVGAGSLVTKDIPPFSVAYGVPCKVHRRFDFTTDKWISAEDVDVDDTLGAPSEAVYRASLEKTHPHLYLPLQACGKWFGDML
jgi:acetyltransferase-like isoleucine patch superfamily enzyme